MRILFVSDVVGNGGRRIVCDELPSLRDCLQVDFVVVNGENAAHGRGISPRLASKLFDAGADVITLGNHAFDEASILVHLERENRILRPVNIARGAPGAEFGIYPVSDGRSILVISALGRKYMEELYGNPFSDVDELITENALGREVNATVLDFHAEATSEKMAMGHWCDGRVSLVVGTHTHVPTADARVLRGGTGYMTDVGMCGNFDSVIGYEKTEPLRRFVTGMRGGRFEPDTKNPTLCAIFAVTDDTTGLATKVSPIQVGGDLERILPEDI